MLLTKTSNHSAGTLQAGKADRLHLMALAGPRSQRASSSSTSAFLSLLSFAGTENPEHVPGDTDKTESHNRGLSWGRELRDLPLMLVTTVVKLTGFAPRRHFWACPEDFNLGERLSLNIT